MAIVRRFFASVLVATSLVGASAWALQGGLAKAIAGVVEGHATQEVAAAGSIEVGFSPNGGGEALVLRVIDSAHSDLKVMAYSFTSSKITAALLRALKRGVTVSLVADERHNLGNGASRNARAAFSALVEAGADVRVVSAFAIHHDKLIFADGKHIQSGSFNYSQAAATKNSENVLVNWNNPALVNAYMPHFKRNWNLAKPFNKGY